MISLDYHETLMAGSGAQAEQSLHDSMTANQGKYLLVVEGAIPTKRQRHLLQGGREDRPGVAAARRRKARRPSSASAPVPAYGGIQSVGPNPTGAVGVRDIVKDKPIINIPGCPPNPYNFLSTVLYYLTFNKLPELDDLGRPKFAYGRKIHEHCERRPHFDAGRFAQAYGDAGHAQGYCLYKLGCKGPATYANCSVAALQRRRRLAGLHRASLHRLHRAGHPLQDGRSPRRCRSTSRRRSTATPRSISRKRAKGRTRSPPVSSGWPPARLIGAGVMLAKKLPERRPQRRRDG